MTPAAYYALALEVQVAHALHRQRLAQQRVARLRAIRGPAMWRAREARA